MEEGDQKDIRVRGWEVGKGRSSTELGPGEGQGVQG